MHGVPPKANNSYFRYDDTRKYLSITKWKEIRNVFVTLTISFINKCDTNAMVARFIIYEYVLDNKFLNHWTRCDGLTSSPSNHTRLSTAFYSRIVNGLY